jgi:hypothetical protein
MRPIIDAPQSKLEPCRIEAGKISRVVRDGIGVEGVQDHLPVGLQMPLERTGENQKRQFHFLVEAAGDVDGIGCTG